MDAAERLANTTTHNLRDPDRFKKQQAATNAKLKPFEGPRIVEHKAPDESTKSGNVGLQSNRNVSRNALGAFYSS
eukprot:CAMPEP_0195515176 /NCGR_PEP_ID=MMETSP0794_2-20130614/6337_1 /TAXON_ID=515487 /ORGANISM="Stephanopyxis turris, Strain CCMP 815" /LENGTH=74 /DNA_ID=CAMNT_0040643561 /DNA_START=103 /DNA_END=327 /DNA_ORIENTATION=+